MAASTLHSGGIAPAAGDNAALQLVGFRLNEEEYAIPITRVREIILMKPVTRLPQAPPFIEGVINLRGSVIPIVNLRTRFQMPVREKTDETRMVVVTVRDQTVACIVDEVTQVMRITLDQIQPAPVSVISAAERVVSGIAKVDERLVIVLDIERLFERTELDPSELTPP